MQTNVQAPADHSSQHQAKSEAQVVVDPQLLFDDQRDHAAQLKSVQASMAASPHQQNLQTLQAKMKTTASSTQLKAQQKSNNTGLPDNLKAGIENLSGISMDHVKVHYNSEKPAQLNAHAYAQGSEIHVAPGQERHLPHEAWHVVQQAQGRVKPTVQMKGNLLVNDDSGLESEADIMGARALQMGGVHATGLKEVAPVLSVPHQMVGVIQGAGLKLLSDFDGTPFGESDLPALYKLIQDIDNAGSIDPDLDRINNILTVFYKLSGGWETGLSDVLTPILKKHGDETGTPPSKVEYGPVSSYSEGGLARGSWMRASLLTTNPGDNRGSDATGSRWGVNVEGHLLNHLLHGPAEAKNFAPFSRQLNGVHSKNIEDPLKKMIYNEARYFAYEVKVEPETGNNSATFVPSHILCVIVELDKAEPHKPLEGGYKMTAKLTNGLSATFTGSASGRPPGVHDALELNSGETSGMTLELEAQFNALSIPWSMEYGGVVRQVLEAAYDAITGYQRGKGKIPQSGMRERVLYLPKTKVDFGQVSTLALSSDEDIEYDVATSMNAFPLTMRPGNTSGSEPESDGNWSPYLKGHLLNHHLHGPAIDKNLTPMTGSLNQQFERAVEAPLKEAVMEGGGVYSYSVTMSDSPELNDEEPFDARGGFFPASLSYVSYSYKPKQGKSGTELENADNWERNKLFKKGTLYNTSSSKKSPDND
ncbi:eCIS core domain-containing protein [Cellvibrio mixtus]|uniref:eCIS core domain-containing protein n=1 Tax=Cellvibrio mixtus TaxID=39650 RepID=UPI001F38155F|nr:DUF4157 domain-containing protein [Cellvibrio mixtus]